MSDTNTDNPFAFSTKETTLPNGGKVVLRKLSGATRAEWFDAVSGENTTLTTAQALEISAKLILGSVLDSVKQRLFKTLEEVKDLDASMIDALQKEILDFNAISTEAQDDLKKK